eukprot:2459675-Alexandrium_andersonii.AAC.1
MHLPLGALGGEEAFGEAARVGTALRPRRSVPQGWQACSRDGRWEGAGCDEDGVALDNGGYHDGGS